MDPEAAVRERYSKGARQVEPALCCPVSYDPELLDAIPTEVLERDYGCGDPTRGLRPGETVLDLGSGSGKACFIASQVVGARGRVIGVDENDDMLALSRGARAEFAARVGYDNVELRKGRIQDLATDLEGGATLIEDGSVDVVISNCVLNLLRSADKPRLLSEVHRVLRRGGRAVISDIVSDRDVPDRLQLDTELWSGCIAGAMREDAFVRAFADAGLYGVTMLRREPRAWRVVEGIDFRSVTVVAYKGKEGPCALRGHYAVYRGPFAHVADDDGHIYVRGERTRVCGKSFELLGREPYRGLFELSSPEDAGSTPSASPSPQPGAGCAPSSGCC